MGVYKGINSSFLKIRASIHLPGKMVKHAEFIHLPGKTACDFVNYEQG